MAGFETGDNLSYGTNVLGASSGTVTLVSSTPTARNGTYCLKCNITTNPFTGNPWAVRASKLWAHASKTEVWYAFGFYAQHTGEGTPPLQVFFTARDTAGLVNILLTLDSGVIRAYYVAAASASPTASLTLLGTSSASFSMSAWHLIEIHLVASTSTTGTCEVWQDGAQVISVTGVRTAFTTANFGQIELCWAASSNSTVTGISPCYHAFDDLRVNDTLGSVNNGRLGDGAILALIPNGVGTTLGGTPLTPTGSGTNWQNVDEVPPSTTDYNAGTTVGTGETYALSDPPSVASCAAVNVIAYAVNTDNGGGSVGITTRTGAGTSEASAQPITGTATYYNRLLESDPADSGAWSTTKLTALESGITVR
jgi:hypothetical protein